MNHPMLYDILKAYQQGGEGAVRTLGMTPRTIRHRLATAPADELKTVYQRLLWEQQRDLQGLVDRVYQLETERAALIAQRDGLQQENALLGAGAAGPAGIHPAAGAWAF